MSDPTTPANSTSTRPSKPAPKASPPRRRTTITGASQRDLVALSLLLCGPGKSS